MGCVLFKGVLWLWFFFGGGFPKGEVAGVGGKRAANPGRRKENVGR